MQNHAFNESGQVLCNKSKSKAFLYKIEALTSVISFQEQQTEVEDEQTHNYNSEQKPSFHSGLFVKKRQKPLDTH